MLESIIPIDWSVEILGELSDVRDGTHDSPKYVEEGYPLITSKNLKANGLDFSDINLISKEDYEKVNIRSKVHVGDILFGMIGTIGNPIIVKKEDGDFAIKNVALIKFDNENLHNIYIKYLLESNLINRIFQRISDGGVQKFISLGTIRSLPLPIPKLIEQQKIAAILSSVDEAIEKTEEIIEQTERVKKGLMQELLTKGIGHTEFKDSPIGQIPLSWEAVRLDSFANEVSIRNKELEENFVLSCTKYDGIVSSLEYFDRQVFSKNLSNYKIIKKGQFAYATIHLDEGSIGLLEDYESGVISPMYTIFKVNNTINKDYLMYQLKSYKYIQRYQRLGQGSVNRRMSIPFSTLKSLKVHFPPFEEQEEIVKILQSVEKRILAAEKDVQLLNKIKQGLMQELLTGKKRVKVDDSEEVLS